MTKVGLFRDLLIASEWGSRQVQYAVRRQRVGTAETLEEVACRPSINADGLLFSIQREQGNISYMHKFLSSFICVVASGVSLLR